MSLVAGDWLAGAGMSGRVGGSAGGSRSPGGVSVIARATRSWTPRLSGMCLPFSRVGLTRLVSRMTASSCVGSTQIEVPV